MGVDDLAGRIAAKAIEVRRLQKQYFRTRDGGVLRQSREAEAALDRLLAEWERCNPSNPQPSWF